jgi:hypothetical protein
MTEGKAVILEHAMTDLDRWARDIVEDPRQFGLANPIGTTGYSDLVELAVLKDNFERGRRPVSDKMITLALSQQGAQAITKQVRIKRRGDARSKKVRVWAIANADRWMHASHFERAQYIGSLDGAPSERAEMTAKITLMADRRK